MVGAAALAAALAAPAAAHTQLQRATPGPAEEVGGTVDEVRLDFLDPLLEAPEIGVTGPEGADVAGLSEAELAEEDVAVARFDPLTEAGAYTVTYRYASLDGVTQDGTHQFTFTGAGGSGVDLRPALALFAVLVGLVLAGLAVRSALRR